MYLSFYGLKENPFQISTNPRFLWLGEKHKEALASLRYGILGNKGFLLLTGGVGTGKTTLINALLASMEKDVVAATIPDPGLEQLDLYYFIATAFKIPSDFSSKGKFLIIFSRFLHEMHERGRKVLLIIDEAQRLSPSMLEEIRLLSNIEKPDTKLINIFFVGQREFNGILLRQENRALRQRITVNYHIPPLSQSETAAYIEHRLIVAGALRSLFSSEAVRQIYLFSRGYPRLINVIADRALLSGFVSEEPEVGAKIVVECAKELRIPEPKLTVRRVKPVKVRTQVRQVEHEESEEQEEPEEEETENQAAVPEAEDQPSAPEKKSKPIPPPSSTSAKEKRSVKYGVTKGKSGLPKALFLLFLLVIAAGVYFWFHSAKMRKAVEEVQKKVAVVVEQPRSLSRVPDPPQVQVAASGTKEGGSAQTGSFSSAISDSEPEAILSSKDGGNGGRPAASGDDPAIHISTPLGGEKTRAGTSGEVVFDERNPNAADKSLTMDAGEEAKAGSGEMSTKPGLPSAANIFSRPLITGFDSDSNNLSVYGMSMLNQLAKQVQRLPGSKIIIRGYSDSSGSASYNERLSLFRANIVRSYLVAKGVKLDTIETIGMGTKNPIASNDTIEGRRKNRRVEIEVRP